VCCSFISTPFDTRAPTGLEPATSLPLLSDVTRISVSQFEVVQPVLYPLELQPRSIESDSKRRHEQVVGFASITINAISAPLAALTDDDAYMALVLNNAQGELTPLEIGVHAVGSKMAYRDYAAKINMKHDTLRDR
jgi:hypothetical protein